MAPRWPLEAHFDLICAPVVEFLPDGLWRFIFEVFWALVAEWRAHFAQQVYLLSEQILCIFTVLLASGLYNTMYFVVLWHRGYIIPCILRYFVHRGCIIPCILQAHFGLFWALVADWRPDGV